jgi:hypothetical protein
VRVRFRTRVFRRPGYIRPIENGGISVVTKNIAPMSQLARRYPLHPLMIVIGVLIVASTAKIGHGMWGVDGMLAFYPAYLIMLIGGRRVAAALSRMSAPQLFAQEPAYARVPARR